MFTPHHLNRQLSSTNLSRRLMARQRSKQRIRLNPYLEDLEARIAPAIFTWTGLGTTNNWSDSGNWSRTGTPVNPVPTSTSDEIIFPVGAARKTNVNNLSSDGARFKSIAINDSGYTISGNRLTIDSLSYSGLGLSTYQLNTTYIASNALTIDSVGSGQLLHSGTVTMNNNLVMTVGASDQLKITGNLSGGVSRTLEKAGSGLLILTSTASHGGTTTVTDGVYQVDGTATSSAITVNAGGTLCGTGMVGHVSSVGGTITAGDQPTGVGTLRVANLTLDATSTFYAEVVSAGSYDKVISSGSINLASANLSLSGGYNSTKTDVLTLIQHTQNSAVSNTFSGLAENAVVNLGAGSFHISYVYNNGSTSSNVVLEGVSGTTTTLNVPGTNPTYGQAVNFTTNVMATGSTPTLGSTMQLYIDSVLAGTQTIDASGNASFSITGLSAGTHWVYGYYVGDASYGSSQSTTQSVTVNQAGLTVAGVTADNKTYDATRTATIHTGSATLVGVVGSDIVTLVTASATGTFDTKNIGTSKNVQIAGLSLTGAAASNYFLTQSIVPANITAKGLTVTGVTASNKVYDSTINATLNTSSAALSGVISGDTVTLNTAGALGQFGSKGIGTAKPVTIFGLTISGGDSGNYTLTQPTTTANITARSLTAAVTVANKVYSESTNATFTSATLAGVVPGDTVQYSYASATATFDTDHVGIGKTVTTSGLVLTGADAANYSLTNPNPSTTADITPAPLTLTPQNQSRTYGTTFTFDGTEFAVAGTLYGADTIDSITLISTATAANAHVGTYAIEASNAIGTGLGDYTISYAEGQFTVNQRNLTASATAQNRVYDGTDLATVTVTTDHVAGDDVTTSYTSATFSDKNVGTGKTVTVSGITLGGTEAANYTLVSATATTTANNTPAGLSVTATGLDRVYDGTTTATVNLTDDHIGSDVVNLHYTAANFASKSVGAHKPIIVTGISIDGADAGNYTLRDTSSTATATVTTKTLVGSITAQNKQYDETTAATIATRTLDAVEPGDLVSYTGGTANFADFHVGTNILVTATGLGLTGADAANYTVNDTTTSHADITLRTLTITANPRVKTYGNALVLGTTGFSTRGLIGKDAVDHVTLASAGAAASANVAGSPYSIVASDASGTGLDDYDIQYVDGQLTVNAVTLTVTGVTASNREYDATTTVSIDTTDASLVGIIGSDDVNLVTTGKQGEFDTKNVGTDKPVTVSGLILSGAAAGNYVLEQPTTTASMSTATLVGSITVFPKTWDGTTTATIATRTLAGIFPGDVVGYIGGTANFDTPDYGTGKTVTATGLSLNGGDSDNYTVNDTASTTSDITALHVLRVTADGQTKTYGDTFTFTGTEFTSIGLQAEDSVTLTIASPGAAATATVTSSPYAITVSNAVITGPGAGGYEIVYVSGSMAVTPKVITISGVTADNKVYDGDTTATIVTTSAELQGVVNGDQVSLFTGESSASFGTKDVGNGKLVTTVGLALDGTGSGNYTLAQPSTTANITARPLTITGAVAQDKTYDRSVTATIDSSGASLVNTVAGDTVTLDSSAVSGVFADWNVDVNRPVSASGYVLAGADAGNYSVSQPTGLTAAITPFGLLVTPHGVNKEYDGTTSAEVTLTDNRLAGDVFADFYDVAGFTDRNVGDGITVFASGIFISGSDAGNYTLLTNVNQTGANITARALTGSITVLDKVYDETTDATINTTSLIGVVNGDDVHYVLGGSGTVLFVSDGVSTGIIVNATGMVLAGADAGNYTVNAEASTTADITPAPLTITANARIKTYGDTLVLGTTEFTVIGLFPADTVNGVTLASQGAAATAHAGSYAIQASAADGTGLDDYTITYVQGTLTVSARPLTVTAAGQDKVYDTMNAASVTLSCDRIPGDDVTASYTSANFSDKNVADGKTVSVSGITIGGTDASNYTLSDPTTTTTANITPVNLTAAATGMDRDYDGSTDATVILEGNHLGGDSVTLSYTSATFSDKNVGIGKVIVVNGIGIGGDDALNYNLVDNTVATTATITAKALPGTITAADKEYDETDAATITSRDLLGVVSGDDVSYIGGTATFASIHVGTNILVTATGLSLAGADAGNYSVNDIATTTADITLHVLTITPINVIKIYGNTVTFVGTEFTVEGLLPDDSVTHVDIASLGAVETASVLGSPYTITASNAVGMGLEDYDFQYNTGTLTVIQRTLAVSATGDNRTYDGTDIATVHLTTNPLAGDDVGVDYTTHVFSDKNVGIGKQITIGGLILTGTTAGNYVLDSTTVLTNADITARTLSFTAFGQDKVYDGTTSASVTFSDDHLEGDDVALGFESATFDTKNVGMDKPITVTGIAIGGSDAGNYNLLNTATATTASITARLITVAADPESKLVGAPDPVFTYQVTSGSVVPGDSFAGSLTRDPGESVGIYPILVGSLSLGANYDMSYLGADFTICSSMTGVITASLTVVHFGETENFTATFTATRIGSFPMTGTVSFYEGSTLLGTAPLQPVSIPLAGGGSLIVAATSGTSVSGVALLPVNTLSVGTHVIRAEYSGDGNYAAGITETPVDVEVIAATTSTSLTAVPYPDGTVLTAHVVVTSPGDPPITGSVTFYDGSTPLGTFPLADGIASMTATGLAPGMHSFKAVYSGSQSSSSSQTTTDVSTDGPKIIGVSRFGFHTNPTIISLSFNGALDAVRAQKLANYIVVDAAGKRIRVIRATYNSATNEVELQTSKRLDLHKTYTLTVIGQQPNGLTGSTGIALDGFGKNQPGTNFVTKIAWYTFGVSARRPAVTYNDGIAYTHVGRMNAYIIAIIRATLTRRTH